MATAFVTGGTGFLGRNLINELRGQDWRVIALARKGSDATALEAQGVEVVRGDIRERRSLLEVFPRQVDVVFHLAADTSLWSGHADRQLAINVDGTRNMVYAAQHGQAACLVYCSSASVFGHPKLQPFDENAVQISPRHWVTYARSKVLAENRVRASLVRGQDAVILNPGHIMGPYDRTGWARLFLATAQGTLPGTPPGGGCFAFAPAVAQAMIKAAEKGRSGQNYLLGGPLHSFRDVLERIATRLGMAAPPAPKAAALLYVAGAMSTAASKLTGREPRLTPQAAWMLSHTAEFSSDLAIRDLDYQPADLDTCLQATQDWLVAEGLLNAAPGAAPAQTASAPQDTLVSADPVT